MDLQGQGVCTVLKSIMLSVNSINCLSFYIEMRTVVYMIFFRTCFSGDNGFPGLPGKNNAWSSCRTKVLTVVQQNNIYIYIQFFFYFFIYFFVSVGPPGIPGNPGREGQKGLKGSAGT